MTLPPCLHRHPELNGPRIHAFEAETGTAAGCPDFEGLVVLPEFVSEVEATELLSAIEAEPFAPSQSGKWKQHHGARINFTKKKVNAARFSGLPGWAHAIDDRLAERRAVLLARCPATSRAGLERALDDFRMMDVFVLRYREEAGSNLDPHVDDLHAYGELILDLSLESESVLTLLHPAHADGACVSARCVRATLPARSLALLFGAARVEWSHAILADDISGQRTSITLRTLSSTIRGSPEGERVSGQIAERAERMASPGFGSR